VAKKTARLAITPTTAAVTPTRMALSLRLLARSSMYGASRKMNRKHGRKVA
jgi:hypothetical protein